MRHCQKPGRTSDLHRSVVEEVKATAQAFALERLDPYLSLSEKDLVRRGRNSAGQGPRKGEAAIYGRATGFETMIGWLFLHNPQRLTELLNLLDCNDPALNNPT